MQIDHVYTWVNANDPELTELRARYSPQQVDKKDYRVGSARFADNGELKLSLRLAQRALPFVRHTYIVGAGRCPDWFDEIAGAFTYINEKDLVPEGIWPAFQSDVAESHIHRIPGLAEHYIYSNDDYFFGKQQEIEDFFPAPGRTSVALAPWPVATGPTPLYRSMEETGLRALQGKLALPSYRPIPAPFPGLTWLRRARVRWQRKIDLAQRGLPMINAVHHVSQPFLKSQWQGFRDTFAEELAALEGTRFRHDRSMPVNLVYHYYLMAAGHAEAFVAPEYRLLLRSYPKAAWNQLRSDVFAPDTTVGRFCLNDAPADDDDGWHDYVRDVVEGVMARMPGSA